MHDPQKEVSWDVLCPRCGDIAQRHWVPGFPPANVCPTCDGDDA